MTQPTVPLPVLIYTTAWMPWRRWNTPALGAAIVAGAFSLAITVLMLASFVADRRDNPLIIGQVQSLKEKLAQNVDDEGATRQIRAQLRAVDTGIRARYFVRQAFVSRGAYLLLGGLIVCLASLKVSLKLSAQPYIPPAGDMPGLPPGALAGMLRISLGVGAAVAAGVILAFAVLPRYKLPPFRAELDKMMAGTPTHSTTAPVVTDIAPVIPPLPSEESFARNWPAFRGPGGSGVVSSTTQPAEWDGPAKKNILWKSPVPLPGLGSPIVWEDKVFLSGGDASKREIYCFNAATGALLWRYTLATPVDPALKVRKDAGYAAGTMATDGRLVYAVFAGGETAAVDFAGRKVWEKSLGKLANNYGHASSLRTIGDKLIVQLDQGTPKDNKSILLALEAVTGKELWKAPRPVGASWSSPLIAKTPQGVQIITVADPFVIATDPQTGNEIWRAKGISAEVGTAPAYAGGLVFAANERAALLGIKTDGSGDVTKTHLALKFAESLPDIVSPVSDGELVYIVDNSGTMTCVDVKKGEAVWEHDIGRTNASPALVGDKIYSTDIKGVTHILLAGREFKEIATCPLGEAVRASAAFAGGRIYIRGESNLYCIK